MLKYARLALRPAPLFMASLALTGLASVGTVVLPATERGDLAATIVGATLGAAIGGFSIDTFLLSRPAGWVLDRGRRWIILLLIGCVVASAGVAAALIAVEGIGDYRNAMAGAAALTVFNAGSSLVLRLKRFVFVYGTRAVAGAALIAGYAVLYLRGDRSGEHWSAVWLGSQLLAALGLAIAVLRQARGFGLDPSGSGPVPPRLLPGDRTRDVATIGKLHLGICAQMLTFRLDQIILARFAGSGALGVYALAVAAMEFAQAGAVITAQRILADRGAGEDRTPSAGPIVKAALPVGVLCTVALAGLGWLAPGYREAWLLGLILLPGTIATTLGKAWSAALLKQRGEQATTVVALIALAAAVPTYLVLIPLIGAVGAAAASSVVYGIHAAGSLVSLRRRKSLVPATSETGPSVRPPPPRSSTASTRSARS
ncbi:lipopolysaccharide biosynthesis protein [Dactylosporangium sp. CS-047395]|uniref:lipopolysaccharide biosynthesis protein n=1 Tax=Dactylosporangium sp. CS-047395 TaxID=3239936 RepID=UPI003D8DD373